VSSLFHLIVRSLGKKYKVITLGKPYFLTWTFFRPKVAVIHRIIKFVSWIFSGELKQIPNLSSSSDSKKIFIRTWVSDKTISVSGNYRMYIFQSFMNTLKEKVMRLSLSLTFIILLYRVKRSREELTSANISFSSRKII
jgi:hypothetical protein